MRDARREEYDDLNEYADRLDAAGDDLDAARLRAETEDLALIETSTVTPVGASSVRLTGSIAPENATEYLVVSDMVRASLIDAAMQMDVPAQSKASVLPGDFADEACAAG